MWTMESKAQSNASSSLAAPAVTREAREAEARGGARMSQSWSSGRQRRGRPAGWKGTGERFWWSRRGLMVADAIGVRSMRGRAGGGGCDRCQMHEGEGTKMQKKTKYSSQFIWVTNDNLVLCNGWLDLFYTTYYQVVVLCTVKKLFVIRMMRQYISSLPVILLENSGSTSLNHWI